MENIKFVCHNCGHEAKVPGLCSVCQVPLTATCPTCGNPVVGEQVQPAD